MTDKETTVAGGKLLESWLAYGALLLSVLFAIAVWTGRIYALSYWNVFGLSPDLTDTAFINYSIMSPNTAVASIFIAVGAVAMIALLRRRYDLIGSGHPRVAYVLGWLAFITGTFGMAVIWSDTSKWSNGTAGIVFGSGFLLAILGEFVSIQATFAQQKELSKADKILFGWLKKAPMALLQLVISGGLIAVSLWGLSNIAQQFGANEAKMLYNSRPIVTIQLDSSKGFEGLASPNSFGVPQISAKMITESGGFLYVAVVHGQNSPQTLGVIAIPISRVQGIEYSVAVSAIGP